MRKPIGLCCIAVIAMLFVAASPAWAGEKMPADQAVQMLKADVPGVRISDTGTRITRIYGTPLAHGATPEESAELFLANHAQVLGVERNDLVLSGFPGGDGLAQPVMYLSDTGEYKFYLHRYRQESNGIPVFRADARVLVRNAEGFPVVSVASSLRDIGEFVPVAREPVVRHDLAEAAVATAVRQDLNFQRIEPMAAGLTTFTEPQLVIWAGVDDMVVEPRLASVYEADNYDNPNAVRPESWLFVADAATGEILYKKSRIVFTDVTGNVSALATPGPKSDNCTNEVMMGMPYAEVSISGGSTAYADVNGDFVIPNGGSSDVTVQSPMAGQYFYVDNYVGGEESLSHSVTPPGPAVFVHNSANLDPAVRAQVNGYIQANVVRDFTLTYNPSYPVVAGQTGFPVYVNRTDIYCPGNAWYDGSSINFCSAGSGYPNTAWSSVLYHEYGHHLVESGGSGQNEYGEGMGDCISVLILDDPVLGYGFFGNCSTGLRNADNNCQYQTTGCSSCGSEIHDCGNLLSGCVWSTREELALTDPANALDIIRNLTVNSILMHSGGSITPDITVDFLTLDDDDGNIGNGTPHYAEINAGFSAHNMPGPELQLIGFEYPAGLPATLTPDQTTVVQVNVVPVAGTPASGTGTVSYRINGGAFTTDSMNELTANQYEATLPAGQCLDTVDFYFSADASTGGTTSDPSGAPANYYTSVVAVGATVIFADDFESDQGWSVSGTATDGMWDRGVPVGGGDRGDPPTDYDGSGSCYLTDNVDGNSDVDGGYTYLDSPTIDLSGTDADIGYALWYTNDFGADPDNDLFKTYVSNDNGGSWTLVQTLGPASSSGWNVYSFTVGSYVTPTAQVKVRFEASDLASGSVVEAGVDAFSVTAYSCGELGCANPGGSGNYCLADVYPNNGDGSWSYTDDGDCIIDISDLGEVLPNYGMTSGATREDGDIYPSGAPDGAVDISDLGEMLAQYGDDCN